MEAKELMIGDWVYDEMLKALGKVEVVTPFAIQWCDIHTDTHHMDFFKPIPLTEEILKANGFVKNKGSWWLRSDLFTLNIFVKGGYCASAFGEQVFINYVHELQHALRLCGLNNFADNFKI